MRGPSTAVSELRSCPTLPNPWPGACSDNFATSKKSAESSTHRAASPQMYLHPWRFKQSGTCSVHVAGRCRLRTSMRKSQLRWVSAWSEGRPVLSSLSMACGGLAAACINAAGCFVLTMASKLPLAKKYQSWVSSESAEQMTDMLPSSALFIHFSLELIRFCVCLETFISSAGTSPAATCDFHVSSCCSAGGCCTERRAASPLPASSFPAEALAVGQSAEDGNDIHASHTGPL